MNSVPSQAALLRHGNATRTGRVDRGACGSSNHATSATPAGIAHNANVACGERPRTARSGSVAPAASRAPPINAAV